ncbi:beta-2 adrenergic receptor-like [Bolinopsis microptera]|uniref:beta-2 adrenergic receptor-like n=1 Tax=Bolinopsis microptera TaxID=2820187 RepID=UPI003079C1C1
MSNFTDYSRTADLTIGVFGVLLGSCTIVANTLVIAVISKFEKRTNSELIFLNIAVIDVVGGLDAIFAFNILLAKRTFFDFYFIDDVICQMLAITWRVTSVVTPLMLSLTSLGRFLAVFTPHRYEGMFSKRNVILCLGLFWTISSVGGTMHLYKLENTRMEPAWGYCDYRLIEMYTPFQTKVIVTALYTIPLVFSTVLLVFCNSAICVKVSFS